jgi:hypothetical protein
MNFPNISASGSKMSTFLITAMYDGGQNSGKPLITDPVKFFLPLRITKKTAPAI